MRRLDHGTSRFRFQRCFNRRIAVVAATSNLRSYGAGTFELTIDQVFKGQLQPARQVQITWSFDPRLATSTPETRPLTGVWFLKGTAEGGFTALPVTGPQRIISNLYYPVVESPQTGGDPVTNILNEIAAAETQLAAATHLIYSQGPGGARFPRDQTDAVCARGVQPAPKPIPGRARLVRTRRPLWFSPVPSETKLYSQRRARRGRVFPSQASKAASRFCDRIHIQKHGSRRNRNSRHHRHT